jgi:chromosome partitioning protein
MSKLQEKLAPVVSILNMKGGVGKTTISAHVFRLLYLRLQKSTLLVDFDPQFNLTQTIMSQIEYEKHKSKSRTILSVMEPPSNKSLFTINTKPGPPPNEIDIAVRLKHITDTEINLSLIPGDFGLVKYSLLEDTRTLAPIRQRFLEFIAASRKSRELICIDCNPSSSFMTNCAVLASTHILVPVRPDRYSMLGLELLDTFLDSIPNLLTKPKLIVILNGLPSSNYDATVENLLRSHPKFGPLTMVNTLGISKLLEASPGYTGFATDKKVANRTRLTQRIAGIVDELGDKLGVK